MTAFLVIGAVGVVLYVVLIVATTSVSVTTGVSDAVTAQAASQTLTPAYTKLGKSLTALGGDTQNCNGNLICVEKLAGQVGGDFTSFSVQLASTPVPAGAAADKARLLADSNALAQDFTRMSHATTAAQYESIASSTGAVARLSTFKQDLDTFDTKLTSYY
jgi:hypothetical protein